MCTKKEHSSEVKSINTKGAIAVYHRFAVQMQIDETDQWKSNFEVNNANLLKQLGGDHFTFYIDKKTSGVNSIRKNFEQLYSDMGENKISVLIVEDLSRLTRTPFVLMHLLEQCGWKNIRLIVLNEEFDSKNYKDALFLGVIEVGLFRQNEKKIELMRRRWQLKK